jgi:hypothetical protein
LIEFLRRWGALGLIPSVWAFAALILFWVHQQSSVHHTLASLVSIALSQLLVIVLYMTRLFWRDRYWASQTYDVPHPPLTMTIAATFAGGIGMSIISFILYKVWKPPVEFWQQLIFGAAYAPIYVLFTISLTLVAIQDYLNRLDQRVPPPIYVHTERLLHVAVKTALQSLGTLDSGQPHKLASDDPNQNYQVLEATRIPKNGGIRVLLREQQHGADAQRVAKIWRIEADRWGRVQSVKPAAARAG